MAWWEIDGGPRRNIRERFTRLRKVLRRVEWSNRHSSQIHCRPTRLARIIDVSSPKEDEDHGNVENLRRRLRGPDLARSSPCHEGRDGGSGRSPCPTGPPGNHRGMRIDSAMRHVPIRPRFPRPKVPSPASRRIAPAQGRCHECSHPFERLDRHGRGGQVMVTQQHCRECRAQEEAGRKAAREPR